MCLEALKENFEFVENNKDKLLKKYLNKYLLVWHKKVVGSFDTYEKAAGEGGGLGTGQILLYSKEVGDYLRGILSVGNTGDWRKLLKEKTGEELSARAVQNRSERGGFVRLTVFVLLIILVLAAGYFFTRSPGGGGEEDGFNVILISLDTLRADHVGAYGYGRDTTPHIDAFAKGAVLFEHAYAQSPNTAISHATMLTSLYPMVHETSPEYILGDEFETLAEYFQKNGYKTGGFTTHGTWLDRRMGFAQGFDDFHSDFINAPRLNEFVFDFLSDHEDDRLFLFVHYYDIHSDYDDLPYDTGTAYDRKFCSSYTGSFTGCRENVCSSEFLEKVNSEGWPILEEDLEYITALYDGGIAYTDHYLNQLFNQLKKRNLFENSLIIITSDHGEEFLEHGKVLHFQLYREVIHVPLLVKLPGKYRHTKIRNPVGVIDIMPTILDMAGIAYENLQGRSFLPIMEGTETKDRFVFSTLCGLKKEGETDIFLRSGEVGFFGQDKFTKSELYDIKTDPGETINLADKKEVKRNQWVKRVIDHYQAQRETKKQFKHKKTKSVLTKKDREKLKSLGYLN